MEKKRTVSACYVIYFIGKIDPFYFGKLTCAIAYLNVWLSVPPRPKPGGKKRKKYEI